MKHYERQGVREPRDFSRWDLWKKYVIGTHRRFENDENVKKLGLGGQRYFFEEATWPKGDGSPKVVAQVQPDFDTIDDDGRYLWSVAWDFSDGEWRDHGKIDGRERAKAKCLQVFESGSKEAYERRQAARATIESTQQEAWPEYAPDVDDGADWRQVKPKRARSKKKQRVAETFDDVPEGS